MTSCGSSLCQPSTKGSEQILIWLFGIHPSLFTALTHALIFLTSLGIHKKLKPSLWQLKHFHTMQVNTMMVSLERLMYLCACAENSLPSYHTKGYYFILHVLIDRNTIPLEKCCLDTDHQRPRFAVYYTTVFCLFCARSILFFIRDTFTSRGYCTSHRKSRFHP